MDASVILFIVVLINFCLIGYILYPIITSGTNLRLIKRKRDDHSFHHKIIFSYNTTNETEASEIVQKISMLISQTTKKHNKHNPSQFEKEIKDEQKNIIDAGSWFKRIRNLP